MSAHGAPVGFGAGSAFLLDVDRCTGCHACELACAIENGLPWGQSWRTVFPVNADRLPGLPSFHLSLACQHCADAPCVAGCPSRALQRNGATGTVQLDGNVCVGCRYCSWVCPYDAPTFDEDRRVMTKCTGCHPRLLEGREPACVEQCPTGALGFGPAEGATEMSGFPQAAIRPAIRFAPRRPGAGQPECTWTAPADAVTELAARRAPDPRLGLRSEWPLLVFTLVAAGLVGAVVGAAAGGATLPLALLLLGATVAGGIATLHLGRPERAWRAIANVRESWLSREILGLGMFVAAAAAHRLFPTLPALGAAASLLGIATLFAMDRVYDPVRPNGQLRIHSADVLGTGLLVAALLSGAWPAVVGITVVKLTLAAVRLARRPTDTAALGRIVGRVAVGAAVPFVMASDAGGVALPLTLAALAELLDRTDFYASLESISPRTTAHADAYTAHRVSVVTGQALRG